MTERLQTDPESNKDIDLVRDYVKTATRIEDPDEREHFTLFLLNYPDVYIPLVYNETRNNRAKERFAQLLFEFNRAGISPRKKEAPFCPNKADVREYRKRTGSTLKDKPSEN